MSRKKQSKPKAEKQTSKLIIGVVIILVVVVASLVYYITSIQKPTSVELAKQEVTTKESAEKASTDIRSELAGIQKDLADLKSGLPA